MQQSRCSDDSSDSSSQTSSRTRLNRQDSIMALDPLLTVPTPQKLEIIVRENRLADLHILLNETRFDINEALNDNGDSALHIAARDCMTNMCTSLVSEFAAIPTVTNYSRETPATVFLRNVEEDASKTTVQRILQLLCPDDRINAAMDADGNTLLHV